MNVKGLEKLAIVEQEDSEVCDCAAAISACMIRTIGITWSGKQCSCIYRVDKEEI